MTSCRQVGDLIEVPVIHSHTNNAGMKREEFLGDLKGRIDKIEITKSITTLRGSGVFNLNSGKELTVEFTIIYGEISGSDLIIYQINDSNTKYLPCKSELNFDNFIGAFTTLYYI